MKYIINILLIILMVSCQSEEQSFDATGAFEADELIVSSEASGVILELNLEEGQTLKSGTVIGRVDSTQLYLKRKQLEASIIALGYKLPNISAQTQAFNQQEAALNVKYNSLLKDQKRIDNLLKSGIGTRKSLDDINAGVDEVKQQLAVIRKQKAAQTSALNTQSSGMKAEIGPMRVQIQQIDDQLKKCRIVNPIDGIVLNKYALANEMTGMGKPLYKIADLNNIYLKAYITNDQLAKAKLNQKVTVSTDDGKGGFKETQGTISWISDKAEFTPKTIQTKDERANLVYAVKVKIENDGFYKIGMYGQFRF